MDRSLPSRTGVVRDRELQMMREAIALVASGASPRVVLAGIRYGQQIADAAQRRALEAGVRIKRLPQSDGMRIDLVVEPIRG